MEKLFRWLLDLGAGDIPKAKITERLMAARILIPLYHPRLRATDKESDGEDPINLNEEAEKAIKKKFGDLHNGSIERD